MIALLAPLILAILLALALGGSLAAWRESSIRWWGLALASMAVQLVMHNPPFDRQPWALTVGPGLYVLALGAMFLAFLRNALDQGGTSYPWRLAAIGVGLNLAVVTANGGFMPQSSEAYLAAQGRPRVDQPGKLKNTAIMTEDSKLPWLADIIALPRWLPLTNVISLGDVLAAAGVSWWAFSTTLAGRGSRVPRSMRDAASASPR